MVQFAAGLGPGLRRAQTYWAVILIAVGVLFLLDNFRIVRIGELLRFWPLILIALGASALYSRLSGPVAVAPPPPPPGPGPVPPPAAHDAMGVHNGGAQ